MSHSTNIADIVVEDEEAPDAEKSPAGEYYTVRVTDFYGLGAEDWLNLIVKVSLTAYGIEQSSLTVLLRPDGQR